MAEKRLETAVAERGTIIAVVPGKWAIERDEHSWAVCRGTKPDKRGRTWAQVAWFSTIAACAKHIAEQVRDEVPVQTLDALVARAREAEVQVHAGLRDAEISL